jgi:hypothetical protein
MISLYHKYKTLLYWILVGMVDKSLDSRTAISLLDKFLQIYNAKYHKTGSMFENVNIKDPHSTNDKMELFYEYMQEHIELEQNNKMSVDIYGPEDTIDSDSNEIYALVDKQKTKYISLSFISLLAQGISEPELSPDWTIVRL